MPAEDATEDVDVAVVGAGAAGLSLLAELVTRRPAGLSVAVFEPRAHRGDDRTWCFWDAGETPSAALASASWRHVDVDGPGGRQLLDLHPYRYVMIRSGAYYRHVEALARAADGVAWHTVGVDRVTDGPDRATVVAGDRRVRARWVFDSRPPPGVPGVPRGGTTLLQHFRGWFVDTPDDAFDPARATLMDFRTPQPRHGVSFGYALPLGRRSALVEYTEFSRHRLAPEEYDRALRRYLAEVLGLTAYTVREVEDGVIPMTDARFRRRVGHRTMRIGTAGGATRPSTGYTFTAVHRQAREVVALLRAGREPVPPAAYPARHAWMDAVLLRALDTGRVRGDTFFTGLFRRNPTDRVLRFLDGASTPAEELALMSTSPVAPMAVTAVERLWRR